MPKSSRFAPPLPFALALGVLLFLLALWAWRIWPLLTPAPQRLTLAPMIGGLDHCLQNTPDTPIPAHCLGPTGSAAPLVQATLQRLGEARSPDLALGYTLKAPLLDFLRQQEGHWVVDAAAVQRLVNTIAEVDRPTVLYLFSTHFASGAPAEAQLARDSNNLAHSPLGPLPLDSYYGSTIYPWSVARTDNEISQRREQVIAAITQALCQQPQPVQQRIAGITLLGEVHQLFPHFQSGMGFTERYAVTDYSPTSIAGFRTFLADKLGTIERLNQLLGSDFSSWQAVTPPDRDIRQTPLQHYWQHIDAFAHGSLPVSGWVAPDPGQPADPGQVLVYLNGILQARTPVGLGRQDVAKAKPELGTADLGWRYDLDFTKLAPGIHQIDLFLERPQTPLKHLGTRHISIMERSQNTPSPVPLAPLPQAEPAPPALDFYIDSPQEASSYFYNPLVPLWHSFRNQQVRRYVEHFGRQVQQSCLGQRPIYSHQLIPYGNPSWDAHKYAVDASLQPLHGLLPGISLYGESAYGPSFGRWLQGSGHSHYGITEFHPLKAMTRHELAQALEQHRSRGAQFVSMFLDSKADEKLSASSLSIFSFDPGNTQFGSSTLYDSLRALLQDPRALQDIP